MFGPYELRTDSCELLREGVRINLQPQPARLLELLARRSGEVVPREEIRHYLWGEDTFIEFEQGLNFSIRKIRIALEDSAAQPRFLETLPRRGYRFLAPVRAVRSPSRPPCNTDMYHTVDSGPHAPRPDVRGAHPHGSSHSRAGSRSAF